MELILWKQSNVDNKCCLARNLGNWSINLQKSKRYEPQTYYFPFICFGWVICLFTINGKTQNETKCS